MVPNKEEGTVILTCKKCEIKEKAEKDIKLTTHIPNKERRETVIVTDRENEAISEHECPECHKRSKVAQWQVQTRSADEAPTTFYKCSSCGHTWRDYGG
jgi:DNA-directed RNA polymerase subunit M